MNHRRSTQLLLAAAAIAAPALLTACGDNASATTTEPAAAPSSSGPAITADDLLTDADTVYNDGADWFRLGTGGELDGDLPNPCLAEGLTGTGATEVIRGHYELRNTIDPDIEVKGDFLTHLVAQYDDEAAAAAAYDEVSELVATCTDRPAAITEYRSFEPRTVDVPDATAHIVDAHYGPLPDAFEDDESAYIMETGIARVGDRLTVITSVVVGQDYNFLPEDGGTPVERMLVPAAERLQD